MVDLPGGNFIFIKGSLMDYVGFSYNSVPLSFGRRARDNLGCVELITKGYNRARKEVLG